MLHQKINMTVSLQNVTNDGTWSFVKLWWIPFLYSRDAHPRPQPCAPTPCQNMHTVPESDEAFIDQYLHQPHHYH